MPIAEPFRPFSADGITVRREPSVHDEVVQNMKEWLNSQRAWLVPKFDTLVPVTIAGRTHYGVGPDTEYEPLIADHISQFNGCPLKALKRKQGMQALLDAGEDFHPDLTEEQIVTFGSGYVYQGGILGVDSETALWAPRSEDGLTGGFYYSPDGITRDRPHQIKSTRKGIGTQADRFLPDAKGKPDKSAPNPEWSVEKGIVEKFPCWWPYELEQMHLFGVTETYLTVWWLNDHSQATFEVSAEEEKIESHWKVLEAQMKFQRRHEQAGTLPGPDSRLSPENCRPFGEDCPFLSEEPCRSTIPLLDATGFTSATKPPRR